MRDIKSFGIFLFLNKTSNNVKSMIRTNKNYYFRINNERFIAIQIPNQRNKFYK